MAAGNTTYTIILIWLTYQSIFLFPATHFQVCQIIDMYIYSSVVFHGPELKYNFTLASVFAETYPKCEEDYGFECMLIYPPFWENKSLAHLTFC